MNNSNAQCNYNDHLYYRIDFFIYKIFSLHLHHLFSPGAENKKKGEECHGNRLKNPQKGKNETKRCTDQQQINLGIGETLGHMYN